MAVRDRLDNLQKDGAHLVQVELPRPQEVAQLPALHKLHDDEKAHVFKGEAAFDVDDVRVPEGPHYLGLLEVHVDLTAAPYPFFRHELYGHLLPAYLVFGPVYLPEAALSQQLPHLVL
jgi:hypothetical protein